MTTSGGRRGAPVILTHGVAAWLVGPLALNASSVSEQTRPWEGLPLTVYLVGSLAIVLGGVAMLLAIIQGGDREAFGVRSWVGVGLVAVALVVSGLATWAIPIWTGLYGVGLLVRASSGVFRSAGRFLGVSFLAALAILIILTELEVGRRDSYGDYPLAWTVAFWVAGVGAAVGMGLWSRSEPARTDELLTRA